MFMMIWKVNERVNYASSKISPMYRKMESVFGLVNVINCHTMCLVGLRIYNTIDYETYVSPNDILVKISIIF